MSLPKNIFMLGHGAISKCFIEIAKKNLKGVNLTVCDAFDAPQDKSIKHLNMKIDRQNIGEISKHVQRGDVLIDLSTNIDVTEIWSQCLSNGVMYMNTAMEEWGDSKHPTSFPKCQEGMYKTSLGFRHEQVEKHKTWNPKSGTTSVFEHGMNPGLISHFAKQGLLDAAKYFLTRKDWTDLNHSKIEKYLADKNYSKLAQELGLHTIHCSENDNQYINNPPSDLKTKFYNTWSCRGFLTEGMVPIQVARGSHEDSESKEFPRVKENCIMSWAPSRHYWAKSWVPFENIEGCLIPHGEAYTIREFFSDPETGYAPSQYYVYDFNPYAKEYINLLPKDAKLEEVNPEWEVLHPNKYELRGYDKVGAMMIFKNNRGWWSGTIMDEFDSAHWFNHKFGPTVLQVAGGVYGAFQWMIKNPNSGTKWAEQLDSEFIMNQARPYLGRVWSDYVDLTKTHIKDCYKFESFLTKKY